MIDCTPGCGSAGRACLDLGLQYLAFGRNAEHASWLVNVLDRAALKTICASGSPLFDQDLASSAAIHFKDLLDQLHEADAPQDEDFLCLSTRQCLGDTAGHPMTRQGRCKHTLKLMSCGFAVCVATYQLCITESRLL